MLDPAFISVRHDGEVSGAEVIGLCRRDLRRDPSLLMENTFIFIGNPSITLQAAPLTATFGFGT